MVGGLSGVADAKVAARAAEALRLADAERRQAGVLARLRREWWGEWSR
jgi:hypothetical protein